MRGGVTAPRQPAAAFARGHRHVPPAARRVVVGASSGGDARDFDAISSSSTTPPLPQQKREDKRARLARKAAAQQSGSNASNSSSSSAAAAKGAAAAAAAKGAAAAAAAASATAAAAAFLDERRSLSPRAREAVRSLVGSLTSAADATSVKRPSASALRCAEASLLAASGDLDGATRALAASTGGRAERRNGGSNAISLLSSPSAFPLPSSTLALASFLEVLKGAEKRKRRRDEARSFSSSAGETTPKTTPTLCISAASSSAARRLAEAAARADEEASAREREALRRERLRSRRESGSGEATTKGRRRQRRRRRQLAALDVLLHGDERRRRGGIAALSSTSSDDDDDDEEEEREQDDGRRRRNSSFAFDVPWPQPPSREAALESLARLLAEDPRDALAWQAWAALLASEVATAASDVVGNSSTDCSSPPFDFYPPSVHAPLLTAWAARAAKAGRVGRARSLYVASLRACLGDEAAASVSSASDPKPLPLDLLWRRVLRSSAAARRALRGLASLEARAAARGGSATTTAGGGAAAEASASASASAAASAASALYARGLAARPDDVRMLHAAAAFRLSSSSSAALRRRRPSASSAPLLLRRAARLSPRNAHVRHALGELREASGDHEGARAQYEAGLEGLLSASEVEAAATKAEATTAREAEATTAAAARPPRRSSSPLPSPTAPSENEDDDLAGASRCAESLARLFEMSGDTAGGREVFRSTASALERRKRARDKSTKPSSSPLPRLLREWAAFEKRSGDLEAAAELYSRALRANCGPRSSSLPSSSSSPPSRSSSPPSRSSSSPPSSLDHRTLLQFAQLQARRNDMSSARALFREATRAAPFNPFVCVAWSRAESRVAGDDDAAAAVLESGARRCGESAVFARGGALLREWAALEARRADGGGSPSLAASATKRARELFRRGSRSGDALLLFAWAEFERTRTGEGRDEASLAEAEGLAREAARAFEVEETGRGMTGGGGRR